MEILSQKLSLNSLCFSGLPSQLNLYNRQVKDDIRRTDKKDRQRELQDMRFRKKLEEQRLLFCLENISKFTALYDCVGNMTRQNLALSKHLL